ncbi:hypothetical protein MPL1032_40125 [Mesorhizobium plurifarium]|uniref:Uncharacterized protein n=1 Tax=Mesorhizobium plurifarium TaxID=69974 RepID=A0A0K2W5M1_MESPL|nr:hypothetical protein MPL1032_40125 [Mesorhizobium plurifarium]
MNKERPVARLMSRIVDLAKGRTSLVEAQPQLYLNV